MKLRVNEIKVENRIRKDFGDIEELAESIREHGLLQPIVVTPDKILLAGERRLRAVKSLGWDEIEASTKTASDREEQLLCEIAENENRKDFTPSERVAYGLELEQLERVKAKERQAETQFHEGGLRSSSIEDSREKPKRGLKTDDVVGKKVGLSDPSYQRAKRVIESGNTELIEKMDKGEIGISTAYNMIKGGDVKESREPGTAKKCSKCGMVKPIEEFSGRSYCKACQSYLRTADKAKDIKVDGDAIFREITEISEIEHTSNIAVSELESIFGEFFVRINPFLYRRKDFEAMDGRDRSILLETVEKTKSQLDQMKRMLEEYE